MSNSLFVFAITIPFDIRDLEFDHSNKKTIPQVFGKKAAVFISCFLLLLTGLLYVYSGNYGLIGLCMIAMVLVLLSFLQKPDWYYLLIIDGLLILFPLFAMIG